MSSSRTKALKRDDRRVIIHFVSDEKQTSAKLALTLDRQDYDCFYAAVFEREDPKLRFLPLAVQQKQIIVTCNYEARRHGLYKLQRVTEARKRCPEAIIVLGEDLTRFRNASKDNYNFLRRFVWSGKVERLGFDEVWADVTDMVDYNIEMINQNALQCSFLHLSRNDPTIGLPFDGSKVSGHTFPAGSADRKSNNEPPDQRSMSGHDRLLHLRLVVGSHLAQHLRYQLEEHQGYSSTVGISTTKLISKLVGNVNKPKGQTTLLPPYSSIGMDESNVTRFLDDHDIGKVPGVGFKSAQKIRDRVLSRPAAFEMGLVYGGTKENVSVKDVRLFPSMGCELLEKLLGGHGAPKGIGTKVWGLINGVDDSEVSKAREVPHQISIEDSYIRLNTMPDVEKELQMLSRSLVDRIRVDLSCGNDSDEVIGDEPEGDKSETKNPASRRWLACPRTLRLTTRPRPPLNPEGTRSRTFNRISRSCGMPSMILNLTCSVEELASRLVRETLIPLFNKLHPEKSGWDLSLMNICAANMSLTAASAKAGAGRDISKMFKMQEHVLKERKAEDVDGEPTVDKAEAFDTCDGDFRFPELQNSDETIDDGGAYGSQKREVDSREDDEIWQSDDDGLSSDYTCATCGHLVPHYAIEAHERFHNLKD